MPTLLLTPRLPPGTEALGAAALARLGGCMMTKAACGRALHP